MEKANLFKYRAAGLQILFVIILLYVASSFFVLGISLGVLPYLHYKFYLKENIEYVVISLALTMAISAYHLYIMIHKRKRRTDRAGDARTEPLHWFKDKTAAAKAIFILIIFYTAASAAAGLLILRVVPVIPLSGIPYLCIIYSMVSFVTAGLITMYHLMTMIHRRKRKEDRREEFEVPKSGILKPLP